MEHRSWVYFEELVVMGSRLRGNDGVNDGRRFSRHNPSRRI
jgi:hypothetical protein